MKRVSIFFSQANIAIQMYVLNSIRMVFLIPTCSHEAGARQIDLR